MPTNAELIRAAIDAFNAGDLDTMLAQADPDLEWRPAFGGATGGATEFRGHAGFREYWASAREVWEEFQFDVEELIESGDQVVVLGRGRGRARGSGIEIDQPLAMLWRLRDGKTVFGQTFADPDLALREAGLTGDQPGRVSGR